MKNLTKIFMAVAAGMLAFSCVTDATNDLAPELGSGVAGQTELALSLEESRTHLGEKVGDTYPLYWSENDQVSVNGTAYTVAIDSNNKAVAVLSNVAEAETYCIAYPVANAGEVHFAEVQNHVAEGNTFESGVSTMYAYSESGLGVQLKHLTGVLKFGITGNAVLSKLQVSTINRDAIAGDFEFDFAKGELTKATASAKNTIEYSFGEAGLQLSETPQYVHIAVPAGLNGGLYNELYVTLYEQGNSGNVMYATIKADTKTDEKDNSLKAGKVREFNNTIPYKPNAKLFVINSVEKLQAFKTAIESEEGLTSDAILTEDIDMTGVEWTPIVGENYVNTIIGNGYAIKGLTAPLFATTSASFKGVHLEDVNISTNDTPIMGALACTITATDTISPKVENCSVSGTMTINNTNLVPSENTWRIIAYGGVVGSLSGVTVDSVVNSVNITYTQVCHADNVAASYLSIGGIAGATTGGTHTDIINNGLLTINGAANWIAVGGCYGYGADNVTGVTNNADITLAKVEGTSVTNMFVGSIYGAAEALEKVNYTLQNATNIGAIKVYKDATGVSYVGGIIGRNGSGTDLSVDINGATNLGNVDVNCNFGESYFGGITGRSYGGATLQNVVNGDSKNKENIKTITIGGECSGTMQLGGCIGDNKSRITSMYNYSKIVVNGTIKAINLGGCINYCSGVLNQVYNHGAIEVNANSTSTFYCAGVVRKCTQAVSQIENHGQITINGSHGNTVYLGGVTNDCDSTITNAINNSTITFAGSCNSTLYAAGICTSSNKSTRENCTNKGAITVSGTIGNAENTGSDCFIGGFCYATSGGAETWKNCHNEAEISLTSTASIAGSIRLAGFIANAEYDNTALTFEGECSNSGNITVDGAALCVYDTTAVASVGGLIASNTKGASLTVNDTLSNSGVITLNDTAFGGNTWIAGCIGRTIHALTNVSNTAAINISDVEFKGEAYISGCVGQVNANVNLENISNTGAITLDEDCKYNELYIAGCLAEDGTSGGIFTNISNNAPISVKGGASNFVRLGGVLGWINAATGHSQLYNYEDGDLLLELTNCEPSSWIRVGGVAVKLQDSHNTTENHGNITINGVTGSGGLAVAGIVAYPNNYTRTSCVNNSIITIGAKANNLVVGGLACDSTDTSNYVSCSNSGAINITENCEIQGYAYIGGLLSQAASAKYVSSSTNSANITFSGKCGLNGTDTNMLAIGGCTGYATKFSYIDGFTNSGNITYNSNNNSNSSCNVYVGGVFGNCAATSLTDGTQFRGNIINTGNITCSSIFKGEAYAGGIVGKSAISISGAQCFCDIKADAETYTGVGWITGSHRSTTVKATNCKIGGTVWTYNSQRGTWKEEPMDGEAFYNFIYGSGEGTDWTGTENYDGCEFLSESPIKEEASQNPTEL